MLFKLLCRGIILSDFVLTKNSTFSTETAAMPPSHLTYIQFAVIELLVPERSIQPSEILPASIFEADTGNIDAADSSAWKYPSLPHVFDF